MNLIGKRAIIGGALAVVIAGGAGLASTSGSASAQTVPTPAATEVAKGAQHEAVLKALAAKLGLSVEAVRTAMQEARKTAGVGGAPKSGGNHAVAYGALEAAAKVIGITEEQLDAELPGKSLAQVAQAHNIDPAVVKAAMVANASARVDANLAAGKTTAERASARKAMLSDRFDRLMAHVHPAKPAGAAGARGQRPPAPSPTPAAAKS